MHERRESTVETFSISRGVVVRVDVRRVTLPSSSSSSTRHTTHGRTLNFFADGRGSKNKNVNVLIRKTSNRKRLVEKTKDKKKKKKKRLHEITAVPKHNIVFSPHNRAAGEKNPSSTPYTRDEKTIKRPVRDDDRPVKEMSTCTYI